MTKKLTVILFMMLGSSSCMGMDQRNHSACVASTEQEKALLELSQSRVLGHIDAEFPKIPYSLDITQGCVKLAFSVNENGVAEKISVVDSYPKHYFEKSALKALKKYKFTLNNSIDDNAELKMIITFDLKE